MDEIPHHFETMGSHCLLVFTGESSFQPFLGGAGCRPSTVSSEPSEKNPREDVFSSPGRTCRCTARSSTEPAPPAKFSGSMSTWSRRIGLLPPGKRRKIGPSPSCSKDPARKKDTLSSHLLFRPLERIKTCPMVVESLQNQRGKIKRLLKQMEA